MGFASRFMDTVGDGSGSTSMNVDGSITPVIFKIVPATDEILFISRLIFFLEDTGSIDSGGFGNGPALTNGLRFEFGAGAQTYPDPTFYPIKENIHWAAYCYDLRVDTWGSGNQGLVARYSFNKDVNGERTQLPFLADANQEEFRLIVRDDLSGIVDIKCRCGLYSA